MALTLTLVPSYGGYFLGQEEQKDIFGLDSVWILVAFSWPNFAFSVIFCGIRVPPEQAYVCVRDVYIIVVPAYLWAHFPQCQLLAVDIVWKY